MTTPDQAQNPATALVTTGKSSRGGNKPRATAMLSTFDAMYVAHDIDAEESVIGSILIDGQSIDDINLKPSDFFSEQLRLIYQALQELRNSSTAVSQITVAERLNSRQLLERAGGVSYLSHLISITPTSLDIEHYADIVKRCKFYRDLLDYATKVAGVAMNNNGEKNIGLIMDVCETMLQELRQSSEAALVKRSLELGQPRLIQTRPPRYIWNVNGKDMHLSLADITQWGKFKNRVISELNFVPIKPKDWDDTINALITHSYQIEAPNDASEEQQLKINILKWFEQLHEASILSDMSIGKHLIRNVKGADYYCFKSTPLLDYLRTKHKHNISSHDLWGIIEQWHAIQHKFRVKKNATESIPVDLWCLPLDFVEQKEVIVPDDF